MDRSSPRQAPGKFARQLAYICVWGTLALSLAPMAAQDDPQQDSGQQVQAPLQTPSPEPAGRFTVSGTVVNSVTGEAVPRALVEIPGTSQAVMTGLDGRFEFPNLPPMQATVLARKPGFFTEQELNRGGFGTTLTMVETNSTTSPIVVKLTPQSVISGRVEANGAPVEGLPVRVLALQIPDGHKRFEQRASTVSDEEGQFRISGLTPGSYYLEAGPGLEFGIDADGEADATEHKPAPDEEGYAEMFYPGVPDLAAATPIDLAPGEQAVANMAMRGGPVVRISGTVIEPSPGQGVNLELDSSSDENVSLPMRFDQQTGKFQMKVPAGVYRMRAQSQKPDGETLAAEVTLEADKDIPALRLVLAPQSGIPITVRMVPSGQPALSATGPTGLNRVSSSLAAPPVRVHLIPLGQSLRLMDYWSDDRRGRGTISLHGVEPGTYAVEFQPLEAWHVESANCGDADLLRDTLTVSAGTPTLPMEITLRDDSASLGGTISLEGQAAGGAVVLVPERAPRQPSVTVDYAGNEFAFGNLAPGDYSVFAINRLDGLEYSDPQALQPYLSKATHVTLQANQMTKVNLELLHIGN